MLSDILIVDDEPEIRRLLVDYLARNGFEAVAARDGREMWHMLERHTVDLLVLDLMLPDTDGLTLCRDLRAKSNLPVIMLTARGEETDRILGLEMGADDYIVKPFSPGEVMARIRAVLRRIPAAAEKEMLVIGELSIHLPSLSVTLSGHKLNLTRREVELLYTLAASPGRVFTRDNLLTIVWGYEFAGNYRAVDSHIKRLRAKLDGPFEHKLLHTIRGMGYVLESRGVQ